MSKGNIVIYKFWNLNEDLKIIYYTKFYISIEKFYSQRNDKSLPEG